LTENPNLETIPEIQKSKSKNAAMALQGFGFFIIRISFGLRYSDFEFYSFILSQFQLA